MFEFHGTRTDESDNRLVGDTGLTENIFAPGDNSAESYIEAWVPKSFSYVRWQHESTFEPFILSIVINIDGGNPRRFGP